jgi:hypothetical protein
LRGATDRPRRSVDRTQDNQKRATEDLEDPDGQAVGSTKMMRSTNAPGGLFALRQAAHKHEGVAPSLDTLGREIVCIAPVIRDRMIEQHF